MSTLKLLSVLQNIEVLRHSTCRRWVNLLVVAKTHLAIYEYNIDPYQMRLVCFLCLCERNVVVWCRRRNVPPPQRPRRRPTIPPQTPRPNSAVAVAAADDKLHYLHYCRNHWGGRESWPGAWYSRSRTGGINSRRSSSDLWCCRPYVRLARGARGWRRDSSALWSLSRRNQSLQNPFCNKLILQCR